MRIITGALKGRRLKYPDRIRPTKNLVRKAIFDVLGASVAETSVLELFAGSGALGIEALSKGAGCVTFVDNDAFCLKVIKQNIKDLQAINPDKVTTLKLESLSAIEYLSKRKESFDLILLDPPYLQGQAKNSLIRLSSNDNILKSCGLIIIEHHKKEELSACAGSLMLYRRKIYGDTAVSIYKRSFRVCEPEE